jgi:hypothetical protein
MVLNPNKNLIIVHRVVSGFNVINRPKKDITPHNVFISHTYAKKVLKCHNVHPADSTIVRKNGYNSYEIFIFSKISS